LAKIPAHHGGLSGQGLTAGSKNQFGHSHAWETFTKKKVGGEGKRSG